MRLALVILALGAIAVGLVHIRRAELSARHEIQQLQVAEVKLRRRLWDQQVRMGQLVSPREVDKRMAALAILESQFKPDQVAYTKE